MSTLITDTLLAQGFQAQPLNRDMSWLIRNEPSFAITLTYEHGDTLVFKVHHFSPQEAALRKLLHKPFLFLAKSVYTYTYEVEGELKKTLTRLLKNKHLTADYIQYDSALIELL